MKWFFCSNDNNGLPEILILVLFCLRQSVIFTKVKVILKPSVSVIFYSPITRKTNKTVRSTISLRSNKTRRKANKTKKTIPKNRLFLGVGG